MLNNFMNYNKLRDLLFVMVFKDNEYIPNDFSFRNKDYLIKYVDSNVRNYCKFMFKKDASWIRNVIVFLASSSTFYGLVKLGLLHLNSPSAWVSLFLIYTNYDFILSNSILKVVHRTHVLSNYKVRFKKKLNERFGFYFAYIGFSDKHEDRIVVMSAKRLKKSIKLINPKLFLVKSGCEYSTIIEYLYSNEVKDLAWLKNEIFLDVKSEYLNHVAREQAMDELEKMNV